MEPFSFTGRAHLRHTTQLAILLAQQHNGSGQVPNKYSPVRPMIFWNRKKQRWSYVLRSVVSLEEVSMVGSFEEVNIGDHDDPYYVDIPL